jgi:DUF4097 and DUF4098 domain-containing protein YvlB
VNELQGFVDQADGAREVYLGVRGGDLVISAAEGARWTLEWSSNKHDIPVVERDGDKLRIRQRGDEEQALQHDPPRLNLRLRLPAGVEVVELETGHGSIEAKGVGGRARLATGNGTVTLHSSGGEMNVASGHGSITVEKFEGMLAVRTGNGHIQAERLRGTAVLESGHGPIEVRHSQSTIQARTGSGDVHLVNSKGEATLQSGHGRIDVTDAEGPVQALTRSGDIILKGVRGNARLETNHGKVEVSHSYPPQLWVRSGTGDIHVQGGSIQQLDLATHAGHIHCSSDLAVGKHSLATGRGDLVVTALQGQVQLETRHGKIHITRMQDTLQARSGNGDIIILEAAGTIDLETAHGRIEVTELSGTLQAHSANGDLIVKSAKGDLVLQTGHGRIEVEAPQAVTVKAHTGSGDILLGAGLVYRVALETSSGRVHSAAELAPAEHSLVSGNGDLMLQVPSNARARIDAQTGHGQIQSDFPMVGVGRAGGGGTRMVGNIGDGIPDMVVSARTANGKIRIVRGPERSAARPERVEAVHEVSPPAPPAQPTAPPLPADPAVEPLTPATPVTGNTIRLQPVAAGEPGPHSGPDATLVVLEAVARGELTVEEASEMLWTDPR